MSDIPKVQGELFHIGDVEQITDKLRKQTIAVSVIDGQRIERIPFDIFNDSISNLRIGDKVQVTYKLKGKQHKTDPNKFFASNQLISINKID